MNAKKNHCPERKDVLADAIAAVRQTDIEEALLERCRHSALALDDEEANKRLRSKDSPLAWFLWFAAAASILLMINLLQAYARLPSPDRQFAAVYIDAESNQFHIYSDFRAEPAP